MYFNWANIYRERNVLARETNTRTQQNFPVSHFDVSGEALVVYSRNYQKRGLSSGPDPTRKTWANYKNSKCIRGCDRWKRCLGCALFLNYSFPSLFTSVKYASFLHTAYMLSTAFEKKAWPPSQCPSMTGMNLLGTRGRSLCNRWLNRVQDAS